MSLRLLFLLLPTCALADDGPAPSELARLLGGDDEGFARALTPRSFEFPSDHGPHPEFRNEWWYVTGNLDAQGGRRFGYELTIFRFSLSPTVDAAPSAWRSNQVYIAHLAVTDAQGDRFFVAQRYSRGALGLAGAAADPFRVWIDDWLIQDDTSAPGNWRLSAHGDDFSIDVRLRPLKPPVLNGDAGLSQKSAEPGNASYYYSITRLGTQGSVQMDGQDFDVRGLSWLDREWSTSALAPEQVGWDWFALQLSDGSDLMFYQLRTRDGRQDPMSSGTLTNSDGDATHLSAADVILGVEDEWDSPAGGTYPSAWTLELPDRNLTLRIAPVIANQELFTTVRYWEGAVDVAGERDGQPISGRGYVELTGYAENE
jgi:predicted secreted hydrolase